jgi:hypothetical protein
MNHARHLIREALVAALAAGGTAAGARVFDHPTDPRREFPALVVVDLGEQQRATTLPGGPQRRVERMLMLEVAAEVQQVAQYARARDQLLADVESIAVSATLPGVISIVPAGYDMALYADGERPICVGRQRFDVTYYTTQGNPAATI